MTDNDKHDEDCDCIICYKLRFFIEHGRYPNVINSVSKPRRYVWEPRIGGLINPLKMPKHQVGKVFVGDN